MTAIGEQALPYHANRLGPGDSPSCWSKALYVSRGHLYFQRSLQALVMQTSLKTRRGRGARDAKAAWPQREESTTAFREFARLPTSLQSKSGHALAAPGYHLVHVGTTLTTNVPVSAVGPAQAPDWSAAEHGALTQERPR